MSDNQIQWLAGVAMMTVGGMFFVLNVIALIAEALGS